MFSGAVEAHIVDAHIKKHLYYYAFLCSVVSSLILVYNRVIIQTDTVVYLASAQAFLDEGLSGARAISSNAFLSVIIALVSEITGLSMVLASDIVNTLLLSLLILAFVYLIEQLGGNKTIQLIAAVLILFNPSLIGYRESVLRDPGYWAFGLLSLGFLLSFENKKGLSSILLWIGCLALAAMFRPEAAVLVLAPLGLLLNSSVTIQVRLKDISRLYGVLLLLTLVGIAILYLFQLDGLIDGGISHISRYFGSESVQTLSFGDMSNKFAGVFGYPYPEDFVWLGFSLALIPIFINSIAGALSWPMVVLFAYCFYKKSLVFPKQEPYRAYALLSLIVIVGFLFIMYYLTFRYSTFLCLLLMTALPFSLHKLFTEKESFSLRPRLVAGSLLFVLIVDSFVSFGYSREYLTEGIAWVNDNTPLTSQVMSNERKITYAIDRRKDYNDSEIVFARWPNQDVSRVLNKYDYFVEDTFWDEDEVVPIDYPEAEEVARFTSERGNRLVIYKL